MGLGAALAVSIMILRGGGGVKTVQARGQRNHPRESPTPNSRPSFYSFPYTVIFRFGNTILTALILPSQPHSTLTTVMALTKTQASESMPATICSGGRKGERGKEHPGLTPCRTRHRPVHRRHDTRQDRRRHAQTHPQPCHARQEQGQDEAEKDHQAGQSVVVSRVRVPGLRLGSRALFSRCD